MSSHVGKLSEALNLLSLGEVIGPGLMYIF